VLLQQQLLLLSAAPVGVMSYIEHIYSKLQHRPALFSLQITHVFLSRA
jgi:hypothetical protein